MENRPHIVSASLVILASGTVVSPYCGISLQDVRDVPTKELVDAVYPTPIGDWICPDCYNKFMEREKSFRTEQVKLVTGTPVVVKQPAPIIIWLGGLLGLRRPRPKHAA